jgi:hypothetical protein
MVGSLWLWFRTPGGRAGAMVAMMLCPASAFTVAVGQNAFLTSALITAGVAMLPRRPAVAGLLLGMLAVKPQFVLMVPVALLAGRHWRALAAAAAGVTGLVVASLCLGGFDLWTGWFGFMLRQDSAYGDWLAAGRMHGDSIDAILSLLGASPTAATAGQAVASAAAAACVWRAFRHPRAQALRLVVILGATLLAAPHVGLYDYVMLGVAAIVMLAHVAIGDGVSDRGRPGELLVAALAWVSTSISLPAVWSVGMASPLVVLALIACALRHARADDL